MCASISSVVVNILIEAASKAPKTRTYEHPRNRQNIGDKGWTQPDFLKQFAKATKWKGGMVRGMADEAGPRAKESEGQDRLLRVHRLHRGAPGPGLQRVEGVRGRVLRGEAKVGVGTRGAGRSDQGGQDGEGEGPSPPVRAGLENPA